MISFKEFLSSQEERLRAEQIAQDQANQQWITSVGSLFAELESWIRDSDPNHLVRIDHKNLENVDEPGSSRRFSYVKRLDIALGDQRIRIQPASREVLGPRWKPGEGRWSGRVDMSGDPYGYELYQFTHEDSREEWYIRSTRDYQMKRLDRSSFDAALVELFS